ncbi:hypothetical protein BDW72DRAFT_186598 [Aspergillus terricola var. indicus]
MTVHLTLCSQWGVLMPITVLCFPSAILTAPSTLSEAHSDITHTNTNWSMAGTATSTRGTSMRSSLWAWYNRSGFDHRRGH